MSTSRSDPEPGVQRVTLTGPERLWFNHARYDSNGNQTVVNQNGYAVGLTYDVANRMTQSNGTSTQAVYDYDTLNRRVYQQQQTYSGSAWVTIAQWYYFYDLNGKQIGKYTTTVTGSGSGASLSWSLQSTQVFFKGRLIRDPNGTEQTDKRGSLGKYYPYGESRGTLAPDAVQFATYTGDSMTGLDYAVNRYYQPGMARFGTVDPEAMSATGMDPGSWNRYGYVEGDPIQRYDPRGTDGQCDPETGDCDPCEDIAGAFGLTESFDPYCPDPGPGGGSPPQLSCSGHAAVGTSGFETDPKTGNYGYYNNITFSFSASGGNGSGSYTWSNFQTYSSVGTYELVPCGYSTGCAPFALPVNQSGTETLPSISTSKNGTVWYDGPGIAPINQTAGRVIAGVLVQNFILQTWVTSGSQTVECPTFQWQAVTLLWTSGGSLHGFGSATVIGSLNGYL